MSKQVVAYHKQYGDEITFVPGGYCAKIMAWWETLQEYGGEKEDKRLTLNVQRLTLK